MSVPVLMTVAEYAAHRGCSDSYVRRLRRENRITLATDGRIDVRASDTRLAAEQDPLRGGDRTGRAGGDGADQPAGEHVATVAVGDISLREAMRRERLARARLAELELGEASRQLARVKEMERVAFTLARQALEQLRGIPSRVRNQLAAETSPRGCEALLDAEIAKVCAAIQGAAGDLLAKPAGEAEAA